MADELEGGSALRFDDGQFFSALQDDYCLPAPSHPPECDRLDLLHEIYRYVMGNVPYLIDEVDQLLSDGQARCVLDVGCGTGKWAIEIAESYPFVEVTGVDLVNPPVPHIPSNVEFDIHDIVQGQEYQDDSFDVVRVSDISTGIRDYQSMLSECVRVLKPDGYLIVQEIEYNICSTDDDVETELPNLHTYMETFRSAMAERGLDGFQGYNLEGTIQNIDGLADIDFTRHSVPLGGWSDDSIQKWIGLQSLYAFRIFPEITKIMMQDHGIADPDLLAAQALEDVESGTHQLIWVIDSLVARKVSDG